MNKRSSLTTYKIRQSVLLANGGHEWIDIDTIVTDHEHIAIKRISDIAAVAMGIPYNDLALVKIVETEVNW